MYFSLLITLDCKKMNNDGGKSHTTLKPESQSIPLTQLFLKKKKKPKTWSWILVEQSQMIYKKQLKQKTEMATNQCKKAPISDDKKLPKKIKSTSSSQIKWGTTQKRINRMQEKYRIKREINWYTSIDDGGFQGLRLVFWKRNWWM